MAPVPRAGVDPLNHLTWLLLAATLPGVIAAAIIRVELLSGDRAFELIAAGDRLTMGATTTQLVCDLGAK